MYETGLLTITKSAPIHNDPVYSEKHLTSNDTQWVQNMLRKGASDFIRETGTVTPCSVLASQTLGVLVRNGMIRPSPNIDDQLMVSLSANLLKLEGLCY